MFDYPLPPLRFGLYAQLGLGPEATAMEINEARQELSSQLRARQRAVQRDLDLVYQAVPGLREAIAESKALESEDATGDAAAVRDIKKKLSALEEKARLVRSDFRQLQDSMSNIEREIHDVNLMAIQNPEDRLEYDRDNPPFEIIRLSECGESPYDRRKTMLALLRDELADFFVQAGEDVFHPSDLTQSTFVHDFTHDRNLDPEL